LGTLKGLVMTNTWGGAVREGLKGIETLEALGNDINHPKLLGGARSGDSAISSSMVISMGVALNRALSQNTGGDNRKHHQSRI